MSDTLFSVEDSVVLVSGASRGIGRAIAAGFAARGARVIITGREPDTLAATAAEIEGPHPVTTETCDVASRADVDACVAAVMAAHGRIDTLINVAGVNQRMPAEDYTEAQYDQIFDINLKGAYALSIAAGRHMLEQRAGCQINIDSLNTYAPLPNVLPYAMSKSGMVAMTRGLAFEWGGKGVRVNSIAPGFILTDLTAKVWANPVMRDWNAKATPLGRLGTPDDLVGAALFLASPAAAFITGQTIRVDGGVTAGIGWPVEELG